VIKQPKKLKVLLLQPPVTGGVQSLLAQVEEESDGIGFKPPLGLLYLAASVTEFSSHEVKVIDCPAQRLDASSLLKIAKEFMPDVVGITVWTDFWFPAWELGHRLKESLPSIFLVYGGPHVCIYPTETLMQPFVDAIVVGDGEMPFTRLCDMVANEAIEDGVTGLHFKKFGFRSGDCEINIQQDLDSLPQPERRCLSLDLYGSVLAKGRRVSTMITSRGCPFRCVFCKLAFQKTVCRSAESVLDEFRRIAALGITEVELYDDTFTWSMHRVEEICRGLIREGVRVEWAIRDRVNRADPELLHLMYQAGCRRVHYGVESGVDRVLRSCKKGITTDQARSAVKWARDAGMTVLTYFMFGLPDESIDDMKQTIEFALELDADYCEFSVTIPYPGTVMYKEAIANGLISSDYWLEFARHPIANFKVSQLYEKFATREELIKIQKEAIRRFYFRPQYICRQILSLSSFEELRRKSGMGIRLLMQNLRKRQESHL
jgi:anaerobic magnesium-protoporphyrin IX monomethyl ester cyclase